MLKNKALNLIQQTFSNVRTYLAWLNQYWAVDKVSCSMTQYIDFAAGEIRTGNP